MKFGKRLKEEMIIEWKDDYFNYSLMKRIILLNHTQGQDFVEELFKTVEEELQKAEKRAMAVLRDLRKRYKQLTALSTNTEFDKMSVDSVNFVQSECRNPLFPRRHSKFAREKQKSLPSMPVNDSQSKISLMDKEGEPAKSAPCVGIDYPNYNSISHPLLSLGDEEPGSFFSHNRESSIVPLTKNDTPLEVHRSLWKKLLFFFVEPASKKVANEKRASFVEFYSAALHLQHFCELNLEAVRMSAKKQRKYRPDVGDLTVFFEKEIQQAQLSFIMKEVSAVVKSIKRDFHIQFGDRLEQFEDVELAASEKWQCNWAFVILSVILYIITLNITVFPGHDAPSRCLALFVLIVTMWITEAIPFFCTAMLIPLVAIPSGILRDPVTGGKADPQVAAKALLGCLFNHVQVLVLGGLTFAKATSRTHIDLYAASILHRHTAHSPKLYLLSVMVLSCVISMVVSNVASPLLVLGVIHSTLWEFPTDTNAPKGILLGLAFACNIGGMMSPIASPQSAVAMQIMSFMDITFATWVGIAFPIVIISVFAAWGIILWLWKPFEEVKFIPLQARGHDQLSVPEIHVWIVITVSVITISLWCLPPNIFFGDTGIIALIPIVVFFGVGILKKEDFNTLSWHLMFLLAGGNMLGLCTKDSKMLDLMVDGLSVVLKTQAPYIILVLTVVVFCVVATFVSHTVAAMIMLPFVVKIGQLLPRPSVHHMNLFVITPELLVFVSTMMCSAPMAFPISSFPNINSLLAENEMGQPYLKARDFLLAGQLVTTFIMICLLTWFPLYFNAVLF